MRRPSGCGSCGPIRASWRAGGGRRPTRRPWRSTTWLSAVRSPTSLTGPGGETSRGWWRITSVDPPRSLEFTDGFANHDGTPNADTPTTAVQMRLTEHGGGTRMELRFIFDSSEHMERLERWGAFDVFPQSVGQMDALLNPAQEAL